jgi:hypothetical protein
MFRSVRQIHFWQTDLYQQRTCDRIVRHRRVGATATEQREWPPSIVIVDAAPPRVRPPAAGGMARLRDDAMAALAADDRSIIPDLIMVDSSRLNSLGLVGWFVGLGERQQAQARWLERLRRGESKMTTGRKAKIQIKASPSGVSLSRESSGILFDVDH